MRKYYAKNIIMQTHENLTYRQKKNKTKCHEYAKAQCISPERTTIIRKSKNLTREKNAYQTEI